MVKVVKASSLVEVVVSMTLASMIFSIGILIYLNVTSSLSRRYQYYLYTESRYHLDSLSTVLSFQEEDLITYQLEEGLEVELQVSFYDEGDYPQAWLLNCAIQDSIGNTAESAKIVYRQQQIE